jgi:tRNA dimethylallyltransferase
LFYSAFSLRPSAFQSMSPDVFRNALILTGPTGSGKSALALGLAEQFGAEIVAMDSMTLYRGLDVGTAKPSAQDRQRVPHHLLDVRNPWESASVAWWLEQAARSVQEIESRGRRALFVGGTPLYLKALLHGLFDGPPADPAIRARLEAEGAVIGGAVLHDRLRSVDAPSAERLHPNDIRRVIRALEVWELTGQPLSAWQTQWTREPVGSESARCLWLDLPRETLYRRIDERVERMIRDGWVDEARQLLQLPHRPSRESGRALGYDEMFAVVEGRLSLEEATRQIQMRTRNFARRQLTWFRNLEGCRSATGELTIALWQSRMK